MPLNVFNKNNLNTKQVVEVKPVPSNRVGTAQPTKISEKDKLTERQERLDKEKRDKEERHKAMVDDIRKKQEEYKAKNAATPQPIGMKAMDIKEVIGAAKKQVMEIASKNEEPSTPRNVFEDNTPNKRAGPLAKPAP